MVSVEITFGVFPLFKWNSQDDTFPFVEALVWETPLLQSFGPELLVQLHFLMEMCPQWSGAGRRFTTTIGEIQRLEFELTHWTQAGLTRTQKGSN